MQSAYDEKNVVWRKQGDSIHGLTHCSQEKIKFQKLREELRRQDHVKSNKQSPKKLAEMS